MCQELGRLIRCDRELVCQIIGRALQIDAQGDQQLQSDIAATEAKIQAMTRKIDDLEELAGQGTEDDRRRLMAKVRAAMAERATLQLDLTRLHKALHGPSDTITPERVMKILDHFTALLEDAASGKLGQDVVYKALGIFRQLTGGRIWVHVERRTGRKRTNVRGVFQPQLIRAVQEVAGLPTSVDGQPSPEVEVWLRKPPRLDAIAQRVHELMDIERLGFREAAAVLQREGHKVNSGNVWYSYRRWYEMHGLPVPKRPYNNGRPRKAG